MGIICAVDQENVDIREMLHDDEMQDVEEVQARQVGEEEQVEGQGDDKEVMAQSPGPEVTVDPVSDLKTQTEVLNQPSPVVIQQAKKDDYFKYLNPLPMPAFNYVPYQRTSYTPYVPNPYLLPRVEVSATKQEEQKEEQTVEGQTNVPLPQYVSYPNYFPQYPQYAPQYQQNVPQYYQNVPQYVPQFVPPQSQQKEVEVIKYTQPPPMNYRPMVANPYMYNPYLVDPVLRQSAEVQESIKRSLIGLGNTVYV